MRRSMNFGSMGDIEHMFQAAGLSLAPISTGDASLHGNGVTVLATATAGDIDNGALKGLVVPGGAPDEDSVQALTALIAAAQEKGAPVLAFGEGVPHAVRAAGASPSDFVEAPAILIRDGTVTALDDAKQLASAAAMIG